MLLGVNYSTGAVFNATPATTGDIGALSVCLRFGRGIVLFTHIHLLFYCVVFLNNQRCHPEVRWPIRDMRLLLLFKHFLGITSEIRCNYCDFTLRTCLIFTLFIVNQPNDMNSR